jgi:hypothetical protein
MGTAKQYLPIPVALPPEADAANLHLFSHSIVLRPDLLCEA